MLTCSIYKAAPLPEAAGEASPPGPALAGGAASSLGAAPSAGLLLGHLADHVVEDAPVEEISELHISVKPHDSLEGLSSIQLWHKETEASLKETEASLREVARQLCPACPSGVVHTSATPAAHGDMQGCWPQPRPTKSEDAFQQDPWEAALPITV